MSPGKPLHSLTSHLTKVLLQGNTMTAITSGTYGQQPIFTGAIRQLIAGLFSSSSRRTAKPAAATVRPALVASAYRVRIREANDVRALARSVEMHSPGFAADLYAAASRHEGYDD